MKHAISRPPPGPFDILHPALITTDGIFWKKPCKTFYIDEDRFEDFVKGEELRGNAPFVRDKYDEPERRKENKVPRNKVTLTRRKNNSIEGTGSSFAIVNDAITLLKRCAMQVAWKTLVSRTFCCKHGPADNRDIQATARAKVKGARDRAVDIRGSCKRGCPCTFTAKKKQENCSSSTGEPATICEIRYYCMQHENHPKAEVRLTLRMFLLAWTGHLIAF